MQTMVSTPRAEDSTNQDHTRDTTEIAQKKQNAGTPQTLATSTSRQSTQLLVCHHEGKQSLAADRANRSQHQQPREQTATLRC